jgi:protein subunit release factor A
MEQRSCLARLRRDLRLLQMSHNAEKVKQSKTYKRQVRELNEQIALMKRREHDKARLEGLMKKSEDMVSRLKNDIARIKGQKSTLEKQIHVRCCCVSEACCHLDLIFCHRPGCLHCVTLVHFAGPSSRL